MRLSLLTYCLPNYQRIFDMVIPNRDEYCARHGYTHLSFCGTYYDPNVYYGYQKLALIRDILFNPDKAPIKADVDMVWAVNVQSVITNMRKPVTSLFESEWADYFISPDCGGLNEGVFAVRKTDCAREWLDYLISHEPQYRNHCHYEQKHIQDVVGAKYKQEMSKWNNRIKVLDQRDFNSFDYNLYAPNWGEWTPGQWHPGDLVISFPGTSYEKRLELVADALKTKVIR